MSKIRALVMAALATALAVGAIGAPAAAANPKLLLVNGIPGRTVDVCVGNTEVKSGLEYGAFAKRFVAPGNKTIRFRVASAGNCNGSTLAAYTRNFLIDEDLALALRRRKFPSKVVVFVNPPLGASTNSAAFRYAGDLGDINVVLQLSTFVAPTALAPAWDEGSQYYIAPSVSFWMGITLWRADTVDPFRDGMVQAVDGYRSEFILVGTTTANDKLSRSGDRSDRRSKALEEPRRVVAGAPASGQVSVGCAAWRQRAPPRQGDDGSVVGRWHKKRGPGTDKVRGLWKTPGRPVSRASESDATPLSRLYAFLRLVRHLCSPYGRRGPRPRPAGRGPM